MVPWPSRADACPVWCHRLGHSHAPRGAVSLHSLPVDFVPVQQLQEFPRHLLCHT